MIDSLTKDQLMGKLESWLQGPRSFQEHWSTLLCFYSVSYMGITHSLLPKNNGNLPLPFFVVITLFLSWIIFINDCIYILTGSPG